MTEKIAKIYTNKAIKTDTDRIQNIYKLCKLHFGDVRFVGIKYHKKIGWIAKAQFDDGFENLTTDGSTSTEALRKLKNRVKKIIKRYNAV
jgi:CRISPR/Cas system-associated endoribonuclease Cas2